MKLYLKMRKKLFFIFSLCFLFQNNGISNSRLLIQPDTLNKKRLILVSSSKTALASTSFIVLNELWYSKYPKTKFHTFNDSKEWLQMDKIGHATTSYYLGYLSYEIFKWTGLENKKAILTGGATSLIYMSALEFMDGFYNEWGFSIADMSSNLIGTGLFISQQLLWDEQRIKLKFSFHQSGLAHFRPELLGNNLNEQILKDYNGQTYWLSTNIYSFLNKESKFPKWLNVAFGYGANGMTGGQQNICIANPNCLELKRERQFYLSLDADLTKIKFKSKIMNSIFGTFGFIKIPFPTLEITGNTAKYHWLYF